MSTAMKSSARIEVIEKSIVTYQMKKIWIFEWKVRVRSDTIGHDIAIFTDIPVEDVYLNGEKLSSNPGPQAGIQGHERGNTK